jgi:Transposase DDE domain/Transposase domain (DUF772)
MPLLKLLSSTWHHIQGSLFPQLTEEVGPLTDQHKRVVVVLDVAHIETFVAMWSGLPGRPPADRQALARAFAAKAVLGLPHTNQLIDRLIADKTLRRLCGWETRGQIPSESTFSRAFAEFAASALPARVHEALIKTTHADRLVGHISRDSTAIEARERSAPKPAPKPAPAAPQRKRGRPRKGEAPSPPKAKEPRRLERQSTMTLSEMLADLPRRCDTGAKLNAKGYLTNWTGYKLHIDTADGDIPVACLLTSASLHDSQVAIPLAQITAQRVTNLYDLMDSAYDAPEIRAASVALGHVPIIDHKTRRGRKVEDANEARAKRRANYQLAEERRYDERTSSERVNGSLKDNYGANDVRVRGHDKVFCHLMFGVLALTIEQLMRFVT